MYVALYFKKDYLSKRWQSAETGVFAFAGTLLSKRHQAGSVILHHFALATACKKRFKNVCSPYWRIVRPFCALSYPLFYWSFRASTFQRFGYNGAMTSTWLCLMGFLTTWSDFLCNHVYANMFQLTSYIHG